MAKELNRKSEIIMYQTEDGQTKVDVIFDDETVWLSLDKIAELFQRDNSTISRHIKNIFRDGELDAPTTVAYFATVQTEGMREVNRNIESFNLDVIIAVGYRVKSQFTSDDDRKIFYSNMSGGMYYVKKLLNKTGNILIYNKRR